MMTTTLSVFLAVIAASASATKLRGGRQLTGYEDITSCERVQTALTIEPPVPEGSRIKVKNPTTGETIVIVADNVDGSDIPLTGAERTFFNQMKPAKPLVRYVGAGSSFFHCTRNTPIGLDLDASGSVERIKGNFFIDISGDGDVEHLHEWFAPTEGILVDAALATKDGVIAAEHFAGSHSAFANNRELKKYSGAITGKHLFGDMGSLFSDGFEKLQVHDGNKDGSVKGSELEGLAVWVDANSNTKVDVGELNTLASYGIVALQTSHDNYVSGAKLMDGSTMVTEDLWFSR